MALISVPCFKSNGCIEVGVDPADGAVTFEQLLSSSCQNNVQCLPDGLYVPPERPWAAGYGFTPGLVRGNPFADPGASPGAQSQGSNFSWTNSFCRPLTLHAWASPSPAWLYMKADMLWNSYAIDPTPMLYVRYVLTSVVSGGGTVFSGDLWRDSFAGAGNGLMIERNDPLGYWRSASFTLPVGGNVNISGYWIYSNPAGGWSTNMTNWAALSLPPVWYGFEVE